MTSSCEHGNETTEFYEWHGICSVSASLSTPHNEFSASDTVRHWYEVQLICAVNREPTLFNKTEKMSTVQITIKWLNLGYRTTTKCVTHMIH